MQGNRSSGTMPELRLRRALHARGLRYRVNLAIRLDRRVVRPDIVFPRLRIAIFVDGCFWHSCPEHGTQPKTNTRYWSAKLERNVSRDREVDLALADALWRSVRAWEHEDAEMRADAIAQLLRDQPRSSSA